MSDTRKNHHASPAYLAAKGHLEAMMSDGKNAYAADIEAHLTEWGVSGEQVSRALDSLHAFPHGYYTSGELYYRMPTVRQPKNVKPLEWALAFFRLALGNGEMEEQTLAEYADAYDVYLFAFYDAYKQLGIVKEKRDGVTYWRLPDAIVS